MFANKPLLLNQLFFARNHDHESEGSNIFSLAHKSLSFLSNVVIPAIFTPAVIISTLVSHGVFLSLLNAFLALGYCVEFLNRMVLNDAEYIELFISVASIGIIFTITLYSAPIAAGLNLLSLINFINLLSTSVNSFFLIRNFIVPPLEARMKNVLNTWGFNVQRSSIDKPPLTLKKHRAAIDLYLTSNCQTNTWENGFLEGSIIPINTLLSKLTEYLKKYNEPFLGSLINQEKIGRVNKARQELMRGNAVNSLSFIREKISYKTTKIKELEKAITLVEQEKSSGSSEVSQNIACFFKNKKGKQHNDILDEGLILLNNKLTAQKTKVDALKVCLPSAPQL
ncbi:MAG: hypothetical protein NXI01_07465 [Gammaproteobacteria bacterium]|nr:hypothetical protein [Gammaproteobacteria bacterium]